MALCKLKVLFTSWQYIGIGNLTCFRNCCYTEWFLKLLCNWFQPEEYLVSANNVKNPKFLKTVNTVNALLCSVCSEERVALFTVCS